MQLGFRLYGGSLGLWRVRRTERRPLAVKPRGMQCRCVARRNKYKKIDNLSRKIYGELTFVLIIYSSETTDFFYILIVTISERQRFNIVKLITMASVYDISILICFLERKFFHIFQTTEQD